jgi:hypothetical protein
MSFFEKSFVHLRPYLYHTTSGNNLKSIIDAKRLFSAGHLLALSGGYGS